MLFGIRFVEGKDYEFDGRRYSSSFVHNKSLITAVIKKDEGIKEALKNKKKIRKELLDEIESNEELFESHVITKSEKVKFDIQAKTILSNVDRLLDLSDYISLEFTNIDYLDFIERNIGLIGNKPIHINKWIEVGDYETLDKIKEKYKDYLDQIYIRVTGNMEALSINEAYHLFDQVKNMISSIERLNLSPLENIMYVYDLLKSRVYRSENRNQGLGLSRDLYSVLNSEYIVCSGFSNLFSIILNGLGVDMRIETLKRELGAGSGHSRNYCYVKDPKYNVDGVYFFDVTFDSRDAVDDNNYYLYNYDYFLKTNDEINAGFHLAESGLKSVNFPYLGKDLFKVIDSPDKEYPLRSSFDCSNTAGNMTDVVFGENVIKKYNINTFAFNKSMAGNEEATRLVRESYKYFSRSISADIYVQLLNNVRKVEYYLNPDITPYSVDDLYFTAKINGWRFNNLLTPEEQLLALIFHEDTSSLLRKAYAERFKKLIEEKKISSEISSVKLTRCLRNYLMNSAN